MKCAQLLCNCVLFVLALPTILVLIKNTTDKYGRELRKVNIEKDTILITGSNSGIGFHAAKTMNALGFTVFAGVRKLSKADELKKQAKYPDKIIPVELDVTNNDHILKALIMITQHVGDNGLNALFLAAGYMPAPSVFEDTPMETYRKVMEIEYFASVEITKAFLPLIKKADGRIIYNSDCNPSGIAFMTAIWPALWATCPFVNGLDEELRKSGSKARAIIMSPGPVFTPGAGSFVGDIPDPSDPKHEIYAQFIGHFVQGGQGPATTTSADLAHAVLSKKPWDKYYPSNSYPAYVFGHMVYRDWLHWLEEKLAEKKVNMEHVPDIMAKCNKQYDVQLDSIHTEL